MIGQGNAKQAMACAVYNHYSRVFHNLTKRRDAMEAGRSALAVSNSVRPPAIIANSNDPSTTDFPATKPKHMLDKSNILLLGPSGSGKTLMAKRIAEILKVPFSTNDATCFTQAGYVGDDVEQCVSRLLQNAGGDLKKTEIGRSVSVWVHTCFEFVC